jgi:four helix bundle protein
MNDVAREMLFEARMTVNSYRDLIVWQKGVALATDVFTTARAMPYRDHMGIGVQLQRSAVSIPSNVAEGWARGLGRSYPFHLRVALGSEAELQTELEIALRARMITASVGERLLLQTAELGRMLHGLFDAVSATRGAPQRHKS